MKEPVQMPLQASACEIEKITRRTICGVSAAKTRIWHFSPVLSGTLTLASWRPTTTIKRSNRNNGVGKTYDTQT